MTENDLKSHVPEWILHSEVYYLVITDLEGRYVFVNEVFKKRFSCISNNFIGQPSFMTIYPEYHQDCLRAVEKCFANPNKVVKVDLRKPDTNREDFYWTSWEFSLLKDNDKNPMGILCIGHEITKTEKASQQAKEFAQKVETIIESITEGFYQLDKDWRFIKMNSIAEQILGKSKKNLLGRKIWDVFPHTPNDKYPEYFYKAVSENTTVTFEDYRHDLGKWFSAVVYPSVEGLSVFIRDITQQKTNQICLQLSENKLRAILNSTPDGNILIGTDFKILCFNKTAARDIYQFFAKNIEIGQDFRDYLAPRTKDVFLDIFQKATEGEVVALEFDHEVNNKKIWFSARYFPAYDENGQIFGITYNYRNISRRKKIEQELRESEYKLNAIYNSTTEASTFIDRNLVIQYNNKVARQVTKQIFGKEAQVGDYSLDYILPEYKTEFEEYYKRVLTGESIVVERTDGTNWWQLAMYPVHDEQQNIIGIAHNVQDITERKTKEIQLQESEQKLQKTIESIPNPLLIVGEDITIQYVNEEFEKVFGYTQSEVLGKKIDFLIPERFRVGHAILQQNYMQKGSKSMRMGRFLPALTKSGSQIYVNSSLNTFSANGKRFVIVVLEDVSELKKRQEIILKQNEVLQEIAWQQSHEVRRPLANILGLCDLLKSYPSETEEMKNIYIDAMLKASQELDLIIHRIVNLSYQSKHLAH